MKHTILALLLLILNSPAYTQIVQKGTVYELNSNKTPIAGVQISFANAPPTDTDGGGRFSLYFAQKDKGDLLLYESIYKKGYELVNEKELQATKLSSEPIKIILCKKGLIAQKRIEYYDISIAAITAGHQRRIDQLKQELANAAVSEETYQEQIQQLSLEKDKAIAYAEELAERFARTNFDDVSSLYQQAFEQFQLGNIAKAIDLLESVDFISRAAQRIAERKRIANLEKELQAQYSANEQGIQEDMRSIKLSIDLYLLQFEYEKASLFYQKLWELDPSHLENTIAYADFLQSRKQYDKALEFWEKVLANPTISNSQRLKAYIHTGELQEEIGEFEHALTIYEQAHTSCASFHKKHPNSPAAATSLALVYTKLGGLYQRKFLPSKALNAFDSARAIFQQLYESKGQGEANKVYLTEQLARLYSALAGVHKSLEAYDKADTLFEKSYQLFQALYRAAPADKQLMYQLAVTCTSTGTYHFRQNHPEKAMFFLLEAKDYLLQLSESQPKNASYKQALSVTYSKLGQVYQVKEDWEQAVLFFTQRIELSKELYLAYPKSIDFREDMGSALYRVASLLEEMDKLVLAISSYYKSAEIFSQLYQQTNLETYKNIAIVATGMAMKLEEKVKE